ncbi:MAG TPA: NADPH-dependent assimilatory sulfite reductase hemoprotein subunit [Holophagaceae bacterium]|jgi:sulfite reductase beta subunit-like hemoprotein|nr:NADPH-dependent assimilatory sulfite reductase hemoprotein subunit [Holophagaceae bacterium]
MTAPLESPAEALKRGSRHLRGTLAEELASPEHGFSADAQALLKPHGFYQQKDRDRKGDPSNPPVLMVRGRIPGGRLSAAQYLVWDGLAGRYGDNTLRLTTRQSIELHGILKGDAKAALKGLHAALLSAKGACGDVVRNVTQAPNPWNRLDLAQLDAVAESLARHFEARSNAYAEIWLDGERVDADKESEPLLGDTYLPRKFKIAITAAGENLLDLYTNDLGFAATYAEDGRVAGFFVFAGGGMGMTHNDPTTFPRLADLLGWIPADQLLPVAEAVVTTQRDHGNRADRKRARLKYLIASKGLSWFVGEVEKRWGGAFEARGLPPWSTSPVLGWIARGDGTWALGFHVESGRVADRAGHPLRSALRDLVEGFELPVLITPDQDLILLDILDDDRADIEDILIARGIDPASPSKLHDRALACPALPFCGLAITEAERVLPEVLTHLEAALARHGLSQRAPVFRMTGCANGCARPYSAELALAGQAPGRYALYAGGSEEGDRLAFEVAQKIALADLPDVFDRLVSAWRKAGDANFGDFAARAGAQVLRTELDQKVAQ